MKKVKVKVSGGEPQIKNKEFSFVAQSAKEAVLMAANFADGYATALAEGGRKLYIPFFPSSDGYIWWSKDSDLEVKVVNERGETVRTENDI